jgi:hypothetical protein
MYVDEKREIKERMPCRGNQERYKESLKRDESYRDWRDCMNAKSYIR